MKILCLILSLIFSHSVMADIYIIVNERSDIDAISQKQIAALYLGRKRAMESNRVTILERPDKLRAVFFEQLIDMSLSQVNAYWAKLQFSGRVRLPEVIETEAELFSRLKGDVTVLGYSQQKPTEMGLKVILTIEENEE